MCLHSQCGGKGCNGIVSLSTAALKNAKNVTDHLTHVDEELQGVARKVPSNSMKSSDGLVRYTLPLGRYWSCFLCTVQEYSLTDTGCEKPGDVYAGESTEKEDTLWDQQQEAQRFHQEDQRFPDGYINGS